MGLYDNEWDLFSNFYDENPTGILKKKDLKVEKTERKIG
jgi:hypothetical protein